VTAVAFRAFEALTLPGLRRAGTSPQEVVAAWHALLGEPGEAARVAALVVAEPDGAGDEDLFATHPGLHQRLANVAALPDESPVDRDRRPATALLGDPAHWSAWAAAQWLGPARRPS
jgi:hypothetical protein